MGLEVVRLGDKIDINFLHQNNGKTYKSSVCDIISDKELEITMPTDEGKIVVFQVGIECQFYFYTQKGLFTCDAVITGRARRDNFLVLMARVTSAMKKFQRRDYYRVNCLLDFSYYKITDEVAALETTEDLFEEITNPDYIIQKMLARTRDLSGGGIRFNANEILKKGDKLLCVLHLQNDKMDRMFYLVSEVIDCNTIEQVRDKWVVRAKWIFKNLKDRDLIVRYVFEEDRKLRKKENG
ncbi:MAG: flagellar brake protein [Agathobacter sp.]|nr:flagellar brake protein [Agathobacter sp.]